MAAFRDGQVIEHVFSLGWRVAQVVGYAPGAEQDDPADPAVYIRACAGGTPFPVRESDLRVHEPGGGGS